MASFNRTKHITLKPGERWVVDQQCMILSKGYLADWQLYEAGSVFENNSNQTETFEIDYGEEPKPSSPTA